MMDGTTFPATREVAQMINASPKGFKNLAEDADGLCIMMRGLTCAVVAGLSGTQKLGHA
jgi:hypothetical protein